MLGKEVNMKEAGIIRYEIPLWEIIQKCGLKSGLCLNLDLEAEEISSISGNSEKYQNGVLKIELRAS